MAILVYTENWDGKFKKLSFELVSYAAELAKIFNTSVSALSIGNVENDELNKLGNYGATKIITISDNKWQTLDNQAFTSAIANVAEKEAATVILFANNNIGKALAPRLSAKMKAGLVTGVIGVPLNINPFTITKKTYTSKAIANIIIKTPIKVLTLMQNSFGIIEMPKSAVIENHTTEINVSDFKTQVTEVNKVKGKILLNDAEIVVSGGRGMKGPENWGLIEELAQLLGAATACSRPVSDEGWRPHDEHTGQTGKIIAPNLYFAFGISGAIQHLGGVSSSKCIVAVNKDPDAPIFEAADYGIIGDVMKVLPELIASVKEFKAS